MNGLVSLTSPDNMFEFTSVSSKAFIITSRTRLLPLKFAPPGFLLYPDRVTQISGELKLLIPAAGEAIVLDYAGPGTGCHLEQFAVPGSAMRSPVSIQYSR
jgi:hypothetical protein